MIAKFVLLCAVAFSQASKLHHHMTEDEIQTVFQVPRHAVPDYEVVPLFHTLHKRSADDEQVVRLKAFGNNVQLNLTPNRGLLYGIDTPVITAVLDNQQPPGIKFTKLSNPYKRMGIPYQDAYSKSAVILTKNDDGSMHMSGKILDEYVIQPAPQRLNNLTRSTRSTNETYDSFEQTHHHVIFKQPHPTREQIQQGIQLVKPQSLYRDNSTGSRSKSEVSAIVYPEILVFMDYTLYTSQDSDLKKALTYLLAFWNAVDLRYKVLSKPKIQLNIAGFVISIENGTAPFIDNNYNQSNLVNAYDVLGDMNRFFYPDGQIPAHWDITVAMTKLDLYGPNGSGLMGLATLSGACVVSSAERMTNAVGVIEDNGGYSEILSVAHELGHLLGADHDGEYCGQDAGFLMSPTGSYIQNTFYWSQCSMQAIHAFITSAKGQCLYNVPEPGTPLQRVLPGKLITLDEQCQKLTGGPVCPFRPASPQICTQLWCSKKNNGCETVGPAVEGSRCGDNQYCINGECVPDGDGKLVVPLEDTVALPEVSTTANSD